MEMTSRERRMIYSWDRLRKLRSHLIPLVLEAIDYGGHAPETREEDRAFLASLPERYVRQLDALLRLIDEFEVRR